MKQLTKHTAVFYHSLGICTSIYEKLENYIKLAFKQHFSSLKIAKLKVCGKYHQFLVLEFSPCE